LAAADWRLLWVRYRDCDRFATDGLTYGTLASLIIADNRTGAASAWGDLYRANRVTPVKSAPSFLDEQ
jgi:hypothetical protein